MNRYYPLIVAILAVALVGPAVTEWVGGLTQTIAAETAATMKGN